MKNILQDEKNKWKLTNTICEILLWCSYAPLLFVFTHLQSTWGTVIRQRSVNETERNSPDIIVISIIYFPWNLAVAVVPDILWMLLDGAILYEAMLSKFRKYWVGRIVLSVRLNWSRLRRTRFSRYTLIRR